MISNDAGGMVLGIGVYRIPKTFTRYASDS